MRRALHIWAVFLALGAVCGFAFGDDSRKEHLFGSSGKASLVSSSNDDVGVVVESSGMFSIGTADGRALLFGYPYSARTTHSNFYVDGSVAGSYSDTISGCPPPAEMVVSPRLAGDTVVCAWRHGGILFRAALVPTYLGDVPQVRISYTATNEDVVSHMVGLLLFLDTMIGTNDCAPIATPLGYFATEQEFLGDVPSFWQAFEESPFQEPDKLVGQGILSGWDATPPDVLLYGDFWHYYPVGWDYDFVGGIYSDSSVLLRWNAAPLAPGEARTFVTYYGLGGVGHTVGDVSLALSYPSEIVPAGCEGFSPDTFAVNLLVSAVDTLSGGLAELSVPEFLVIVDDVTKPIEPALLLPGDVGSASWRVGVLGLGSAGVLVDSIVAVVTAPGYLPSRLSRAVRITAGDGEPPHVRLLSALPETVASDTLTVEFRIDDPSGVDTATLRVELDGAEVGFSWAPPLMTVHLADLGEGEHRLVVGPVGDVFGCAGEPVEISFFVRYPPTPECELLVPPSGEFTGCESDTIAVRLLCPAGCEPSEFSLRLDGEPIPFGWLGDSVLVAFYEHLPDGEHTLGLSGADALGRVVDSVWGFYVDTRPPEVSCGSLLSLRAPTDVLSFVVSDGGAGVDSSSVGVRVAYGADTVELAAGAPGVEFHDGVLSVVVGDMGIPFDGCDELALWVFAADAPCRCAPNRVDTLVLRASVPCTPPEIVVLSPRGAVSCDTVRVVMLIVDDEGVYADSAWVSVGGVRYDLSSPRLSLRGDTLVFSAPVGDFPPGEAVLRVGGIRDGWGNELGGEAFVSVLVDTAPPRVLSVFPEGVLTGTETVGFLCVDDASGVSPERSYIVCDGDTMRLGEGMGYDGGELFVPAAFWLSALVGETLRVCAHVVDNVVECEPNFVDTCVSFPVEQSGPAASVIEPPADAYIGCGHQRFSILWYDPDGVDRSASTISVLGEEFSAASDRCSWDGDVVSFDVDLAGVAGSLVVSVHGVDSLGFSADTSWAFGVDFRPPRVVPLEPAAGSQITAPFSPWKILLSDDGAGVDTASVNVIVDGNLFTSADDAVSLSGDTVIFDPNLSGISFGDEVNVAVSVSDLAFGCPNEAHAEWSYSVFRPSVWWELVSPLGVVSCDTVEVVVVLHANFGLDLEDVVAFVGGDVFPSEAFGDTVLVLVPAQSLSGGANTVALWGIVDADHGVAVDETMFVPILFDALPPTIVPIYPLPGSRVAGGSPIIVRVFDDLAGVDRDGVMVSVNGDVLVPGVGSWRGDTLSVTMPGDVRGDVEVCVVAADRPDVCDPHETRLCWEFVVPGAGPSVRLICPQNDAFTHDPRQGIRFEIESPNGLEPGGITLLVDGVVYGVDGDVLRLEGGILDFTPPGRWNDGDTVTFSLSCRDELGLEASLAGRFFCDLSPPSCFNPQPEGVVESAPGAITVGIEDAGAGVDPRSIAFRVGELLIPFDNYAVTYVGGYATLDLDAAGVHIGSGDTVDVCVFAADLGTGYGEPNIMSDCCFWFLAVGGGCLVEPNPFTPNGDGVNDVATFVIHSQKPLRVDIFSFGGALVRRLEGEGSVSWDGRDIRGRKAPAGPYLYVIQAGGETLCKGTIVLAR